MARLALSGALRAAASLLAVSAIAFALIVFMPADPVMIAIRAWNLAPTEETIAALRAGWGLDRALLDRGEHLGERHLDLADPRIGPLLLHRGLSRQSRDVLQRVHANLRALQVLRRADRAVLSHHDRARILASAGRDSSVQQIDPLHFPSFGPVLMPGWRPGTRLGGKVRNWAGVPTE
jgi:hypothetical protein